MVASGQAIASGVHQDRAGCSLVATHRYQQPGTGDRHQDHEAEQEQVEGSIRIVEAGTHRFKPTWAV